MQCDAGDDEHSQSETTTIKIMDKKKKKTIKKRTRVHAFL
jgi:hypothetical protein